MEAGSSWSNPIWHGRWRIYTTDYHHWFVYVHDDFDGVSDANDSRYGYAPTLEEAKAEIDEWEADNAAIARAKGEE